MSVYNDQITASRDDSQAIKQVLIYYIAKIRFFAAFDNNYKHFLCFGIAGAIAIVLYTV